MQIEDKNAVVTGAFAPVMNTGESIIVNASGLDELGTTDEISVPFFASDVSFYLGDVEVPVDGGWTLA
mgnify:CR=1 FL=1